MATRQHIRPLHGCVMVGSFHCAQDQLARIHQAFTESGLIEVIWPKATFRFMDRGADFPRDVTDPPEASSKQLEQRVLTQGIDSERCCFVYLVNPYFDGKPYFGLDTAYELGWAGRASKPVYTFERVTTAPVTAHQADGVKTPEEIIAMVRRGRCPCGRRAGAHQRRAVVVARA